MTALVKIQAHARLLENSYTLECWPLGNNEWHGQVVDFAINDSQQTQDSFAAALRRQQLATGTRKTDKGWVFYFTLANAKDFLSLTTAFVRKIGSDAARHHFFMLSLKTATEDIILSCKYYEWCWAPGGSVKAERYTRVMKQLKTLGLCSAVELFSLDEQKVDGLNFLPASGPELLEQIKAIAQAIANCP